jgi:hypothetical protein
VFHGLARAGAHIVVAATEHPATLACADAAARRGCAVARVGVCEDGRVAPEAVAGAVRAVEQGFTGIKIKVGSTVERAVEPQKPLETTQPPATSLKPLGTSLGSPALSAQSLGNTALRALTSDPACAYDMPFGWHLFDDPEASGAYRAPRNSAAAVAAPEATADETRPAPSTSTATITATDVSTGTAKRVV